MIYFSLELGGATIRAIILGIQSLFNHFSCIGIESVQDPDRAKRIIFVNQTAIAFLLACKPFIIIFFIFGYSLLGLLGFPFLISFYACLALNHLKKFKLAKLLLFSSITFGVYLYTYIIGTDSGLHNVYYTLVACTWGIFSKDQIRYKMGYSLFLVALYFSLYFVTDPLNPNSRVQTEHLIYIYLNASALIFSILFVSGKFYTELAEKYKTQSKYLLKIYGLTDREGEIIACIVTGKTNKEIAKLLFIEEGTVKNHLHNIFSKTKVKSRLALSSLLQT